MEMSKQKPNCYVVAGSNGAGKSTFAQDFLPDFAHCENLINPDLIAQGLSPFYPAKAATKSARLTLELIDELATKQVDFAFESTLSGRTYARIFKRLKEQLNYDVHLFYLWIPSTEMAIARISDRVEEGGHFVPDEDVIRRFSRSLKNLFELYAPLVDNVFVFDNSAERPKLIFERNPSGQVIVDQKKFDEFKGQSHGTE
jgi:predicted ABC-type ATPase